MKPRLFFWTVSLLVILLASACASAQATSIPNAEPPPVEALPATVAPESMAPTPTAISIDVQAIATSRGPDLEATDPSTVSLASGQPHLVEFFRFT